MIHKTVYITNYIISFTSKAQSRGRGSGRWTPSWRRWSWRDPRWGASPACRGCCRTCWEDRFYTPPPPGRDFWDSKCARIETNTFIHHPLWVVVVVYKIVLPTCVCAGTARRRSTGTSRAARPAARRRAGGRGASPPPRSRSRGRSGGWRPSTRPWCCLHTCHILLPSEIDLGLCLQAQGGNTYFTELAERVEYGNYGLGSRPGRRRGAAPTSRPASGAAPGHAQFEIV